MTDMSGKLKAARERVQSRIRERRAARKKTKTMPTPPRYDEVYFRGVDAMNRSAVEGAEMTDIIDYLNRRVTFDMESLRGIHFSEFSPLYLAKIDAKELFGAISEIENLRAENEKLRFDNADYRRILDQHGIMDDDGDPKCTYRGALAMCHDLHCPAHGNKKPTFDPTEDKEPK